MTSDIFQKSESFQSFIQKCGCIEIFLKFFNISIQTCFERSSNGMEISIHFIFSYTAGSPGEDAADALQVPLRVQPARPEQDLAGHDRHPVRHLQLGGQTDTAVETRDHQGAGRQV